MHIPFGFNLGPSWSIQSSCGYLRGITKIEESHLRRQTQPCIYKGKNTPRNVFFLQFWQWHVIRGTWKSHKALTQAVQEEGVLGKLRMSSLPPPHCHPPSPLVSTLQLHLFWVCVCWILTVNCVLKTWFPHRSPDKTRYTTLALGHGEAYSPLLAGKVIRQPVSQAGPLLEPRSLRLQDLMSLAFTWYEDVFHHSSVSSSTELLWRSREFRQKF